MDTTFWISLLVPLLLSIPLSVIANIYSDPVREFVLKRRHIRLNKKRSREIRMHQRVLAIKSGDPTELLSLSYAQFLVMMMTVAAVGLSAAWVAWLVFRPQVLTHISEILFIIAYSFLVLVATAAQWLGAVLFNDIRVTMLKVRRFERYEEQMKAKWGPDVLN